MRRVLRCLALAGVLGVTSAVARAQVERGEIRLTVTDQTGLPLAATGTLTSEAPQLSRAFATDANGRFALQDLPFGVFRLIVERSGFVPASTVVEVRTAVPRALTIELSLAAVSSDVTVTSEPPLVDTARTGVTFSIGAPQIQDALPAAPGRRILELVDAQPGWLMEANGVLHPRGSEYQTLFVIDGVPMDENRSPAFAPDLQEGDLQGVAVRTGNFPAEYGRKLGGIVEVTTARDAARGFHGLVELGVRSFGTVSAGATGRYGWSKRALALSASAAESDRYLDPPTEDNYTNHGSLGGVTAAYDEQLSDTNRLRFTWHHRSTDFLVPNERVQQEAGQRQERTGNEDLGQGAWTAVLGSRAVLNVRGMVERISATLDSNQASTPVIVSQDRSMTRSFGNVSLAVDLGRHQLKFGGDLVHTPVREALDYTITDPSAFEPDVAPVFAFSDRRTDTEQSLFAQDTMQIGSMTASAGLRFDHYSFVVNDSAFSPRLGLAWAVPDSEVVLKAAYDRAFQTPAIENLLLASSGQTGAASAGAVQLPVLPSRGDFLEGGVTAGFESRFRVDLTAYRRSIEQFADDDVFLNTGVSFPVAFDSAVIHGADAKLTMLPVRNWSGFASYSLLKGTARLPLVGGLFLGQDALDELEAEGEVPISQDQRHTIRGQLRYTMHERMWLGGTVRYGSGLPVELEGAVDLGDLEEQFGPETVAQVDFANGRVRYNLAVDLGAGINLWRSGERRLTLRVEAANITNRLNVINFAGLFSGTALGAPRSVGVRGQLQF